MKILRALWPFVADTWRQSRQQVVFLIMLGMLALTVAVAVGLTHVVETTDDEGDTVETIGLRGFDDSGEALSMAWVSLYSSAIASDYVEDGEMPDPFSEEGQALQEELLAAADVEARKQPKRKGAEVVVYATSFTLYAISMLLFIAACAGYFPAMLEAGAVDIVLAKPIERWKIFLGKYLGGLALFSAALVGAYTLLFLGLGASTGVWHLAVFRVLPLQLLSAATLFSVIGLLGIARRSTSLAMIVGYVYYLVVDKVVKVLLFLPFGGDSWQRIQKGLRWVIPNFVDVRDTALLSIINPPSLHWQPIVVMLAWLVLALGAGYWLFHRRDY
ncbi:ABC-2 family transporter protein [Enhygromyxa salina]|uniref:ABC-2 family transporter protein n=1 Tax=Enhygromyxa salina TaxID=215803 RepID=A0A2S9XMU1_9BACT|nr:ABC transporter permease [Enhygromyxa salina]PRP94162.1 ABC-2 family transporter protein [Enhygromyxa salina]